MCGDDSGDRISAPEDQQPPNTPTSTQAILANPDFGRRVFRYLEL